MLMIIYWICTAMFGFALMLNPDNVLLASWCGGWLLGAGVGNILREST